MDITKQVSCTKGNVVIFKRNKTTRVGKVIKKGPASIGLDVHGMQSNTKIPADTSLQLVQVWMTKELVNELGLSVE